MGNTRKIKIKKQTHFDMPADSKTKTTILKLRNERVQNTNWGM